jgi:hypothetical protein
MFACKLCGLTIGAIPADSIQVGKLYRFADGSFHSLRKKLAPRTCLRPRKNKSNSDHEPPSNVREPKSEEVPTLESTALAPHVTPVIPANESTIQRAFRLKKVA